MRWIIVAVVVALVTVSARAADWFELKDFSPLTQRVAVTIENPADVANDAALVHIDLASLSKVLPDAKDGQVCVVDPKHKAAKRDAANEEFVPAQVSENTLIFSL